jgi:hypothetical protein
MFMIQLIKGEEMYIFSRGFLGGVVLFFISVFNNSWAYASQSWQFAIVSDEITGNSVDRDSVENVQYYFSDKKVILKDNTLDVKGLFSCEIVDEKMTPISYWYSDETVFIYRDLLKKYGINLGEKIEVITSSNPESQCKLPFSEFIKTDNTLMFIYKDRAIFYYPEGDVRLKNNNNQEVVQKSIKTADNASCKEDSNEMNVVYAQGNIVTCVYPKTNLLPTYLKYRDEYKNDEILKFLKKEITLGRNETIKILPDFIFKYKWKSSNELEIDILQSGGMTTLNFHQTDEGTTVKNISSPD